MLDPCSHLGLVRSVANRYARKSGESFDDLFQEGFFGLVKAIQRYVPERGSFSSFAYYWISSSIQHYLRDKIGLRYAREQSRDIALVPIALGDDLYALPDSSPSVEDQAADLEQLRRLDEALSCLPVRSEQVLRMRYLEEMSLAEVGKAFGVTRQSALLWEGKALQEIKSRLAA